MFMVPKNVEDADKDIFKKPYLELLFHTQVSKSHLIIFMLISYLIISDSYKSYFRLLLKQPLLNLKETTFS